MKTLPLQGFSVSIFSRAEVLTTGFQKFNRYLKRPRFGLRNIRFLFSLLETS